MRKRLFLTYLSLIVISIFITGVFSLIFTRQSYLDMIKERLYDNARITKEYILKYYDEESLDALAKKYGQQFGMRMTIINGDGTVIADSDAVVSVMENHRNRPEIRDAFRGDVGTAIRYSTTLETDMMYVAIPVYTEDKTMVLRMAMPLTEIYANLRVQWRNILVTLVIAFIVAAYQGIRFSIHVTKPILEMAELSDKIAQGDFQRRMKVKTHDEMAKLAQAFNSMAAKLESSIGELSDKNIKLEAILTSMVNGIVAVDRNINIILINPAAKVLFNVEGDVIGKFFLEVFRDSQLDKLLQYTLKHNEISSVEINTKEEEPKILKVNGAPILSDSGTIGAVLLVQDITELRRLEQIRSDFVANVSHELKTPLTSIKGFVETLQAGAVENTETARKFLEIIDIEADRLSRLINDILSLSELESRKGKVLSEKVNIAEIARETLEMMKANARNKNISLGHLFAHEDIWIQGNRDRIKQMIINLVDNAIKYTPEGGSITILIEDLPEKVILRVRDTGIGIAKEHIPRLFERFYRVDKGRSRALGGTGLGLAIVKHIVKSMKGEIEVNSQPGKGSEFIIHIPK